MEYTNKEIYDKLIEIENRVKKIEDSTVKQIIKTIKI